MLVAHYRRKAGHRIAIDLTDSLVFFLHQLLRRVTFAGKVGKSFSPGCAATARSMPLALHCHRIDNRSLRQINGRNTWGRSSAGRALQSHCRGQEFDPPRLHQLNQALSASAKNQKFPGHTPGTHQIGDARRRVGTRRYTVSSNHRHNWDGLSPAPTIAACGRVGWNG